MLDFISNQWNPKCDGVNRRTFLRVGSLPFFGMALPQLLRASAPGKTPRAKSCILLWLDGGISTVDTFDMKPDAPDGIRGEFKPISTNIPGMSVCEHLPKVARRTNRICQLRTVVHAGSQHAEACHEMLTGWPQLPDPNANPVGATIHPCFGSVVSEQQGWRSGLPPFAELCGSIKYHHAGFIGSAFDPLRIRDGFSKPDFRVKNVAIADAIGRSRFDRRRSMLEAVDDLQRVRDRSAGSVFDRNQFYSQAFDLMTAPAAKKAFRIDQEPEKLRDSYGRFEEGQATLLARRLVESGVRFVTVQFNGYDTHDKNFSRLKNELLPKIDVAYSALLEDLEQRGMLEETLVICMGEFGRTPKVNGQAGRDHYPKVNNLNFSGAGVRMGEIIGRTDAQCANVVGRTHSPHDLAATIYDLLGVDYQKEYLSTANRPVLTTNNGKPIREIYS